MARIVLLWYDWLKVAKLKHFGSLEWRWRPIFMLKYFAATWNSFHLTCFGEFLHNNRWVFFKFFFIYIITANMYHLSQNLSQKLWNYFTKCQELPFQGVFCWLLLSCSLLLCGKSWSKNLRRGLFDIHHTSKKTT